MDLKLTPLTYRIRRYEEIPLKDQWENLESYRGWGKRCTVIKKTRTSAEVVLEGETHRHLISRNHLVPLKQS